MTSIQYIKFESIEADEVFRYRCTSIRAETITRLADDIQLNGLLTPLIVKEKGNDKYQLIAGYRRYEALKALSGKGVKLTKEIPAHVYPKGTKDRTLINVRFAENMERKNLSPMDVAFAIFKLSTQDQLTHDEIAALLRMKSTKTVQRHVRLTKAPQAMQDAVNDGWLSPTAALAIMEAGPEKKNVSAIFDKIKADYDRDGEDGVWSVKRINSEIAAKGATGGINDFIQRVRPVGVLMRRRGKGYRVSVDLDPADTIEAMVTQLEAKTAELRRLVSEEGTDQPVAGGEK